MKAENIKKASALFKRIAELESIETQIAQNIINLNLFKCVYNTECCSYRNEIVPIDKDGDIQIIVNKCRTMLIADIKSLIDNIKKELLAL